MSAPDTARAVLIATRAPMAPEYATLGDVDEPGDDYQLLVGGAPIGGTYWNKLAPTGQRWSSWGPAGISHGHYSRDVAEQAQVAAHRVALGHAGRLVVVATRDWHEGPVVVHQSPELRVVCPLGHPVTVPDRGLTARLRAHRAALRGDALAGLWVVRCTLAEHTAVTADTDTREAVPA